MCEYPGGDHVPLSDFLDVEPDPAVIQRFLSKISKDAESGCWNWTGHVSEFGYGRFYFRDRVVKAHRFAYAVWRRPLIAGLTIDHKCRNTRCCNPWHMELITMAENVARANRARIRNRKDKA